jgi:hypothetical protein
LMSFLTKDHDQAALYVNVISMTPGLTLRGKEFPGVPSSVLSVLNPSPQPGSTMIVREKVVYQKTIPIESVVNGFKFASFEVKRKLH